MMRVMVWGSLAGLWLMVSAAHAGSGFQSFPQGEYMQRKMGGAITEQENQSGLDAFYRWKQKAIEEEETAGAVQTTPSRPDVSPAVEKPLMVVPGVPLPAPGKTETGQMQVPGIQMRTEPFDEPEPRQPVSGAAQPVPENASVPLSRTVQEPSSARSTSAPEKGSWLGRLFSGGAAPETNVVPSVPPEYIIGVGDVLEISVWKDEALSKVVPVLPDGTIHFPLLGQRLAAGKTVADLQREIEAGIAKYVPNPFVDVSVQQVNSMMVYIIGKVHQPGRFVINANVTVLQALAMAGGLNTFAKGEQIKIIRQTDGEQQVIRFNYEDAASGRDLSGNIRLRRGDVVVVN